MKESIWIIKVFEKFKLSDEGVPVDNSEMQTIGWFDTEEEAVNVVKCNGGDMWETCFDYAVVEEIPMGLYGFSKRRTWWRYSGKEKDAYERIQEPDYMYMWTNVM